MTFEEIKSAVMNLGEKDKRRAILEIVPAIWPAVVNDDSCIQKIRDLVDDAAIKEYREQHMDNV